MSRNTSRLRSELAACAEPLLDPATLPGHAFSCLGRLEELLASHTSFGYAERIESGETDTDQGLAISPTQAAMCLRDVRRSHAFVSGLHTAISRKLGAGATGAAPAASATPAAPPAPVHVLYAGCGPYAVLALPVMAALTPDEVRFTLLDVHGACIASVRALVEAFGLGGHVTDMIVADATRFSLPEDDPPQIILTEAMNVCLEKEPQVAIVRNLLAQAPDAVLIPESVRVDAFLVDPAKEFPRIGPDGMGGDSRDQDRLALGTAFELSRESALGWSEIEGDLLPGGSVRIPDDMDSRYEAMLLTSIDAFNGLLISGRDSGLTVPRPFPVGVAPAAGTTIEFRYRLGRTPGLVTLPASGGRT